MLITQLFTRRGFFARLIGLVAGVSLVGCGRADTVVDKNTLVAVLDTFIPADGDPGAVEAGVPERILARISNDPVSLERYRRLLAWVAERSRAAYQRPFADLLLPERHGLLEELYHSSGSNSAQLRIDLNVVLKHCFHAFYSSPAAGPVIGYHPPIEGGYPDYATSPESIT